MSLMPLQSRISNIYHYNRQMALTINKKFSIYANQSNFANKQNHTKPTEIASIFLKNIIHDNSRIIKKQKFKQRFNLNYL